MTEQIITTITGLEFTTEGRPIAHGAIIREGAGTLEETMKAGGAQMGTLHPMDGCPMGRVEAKFAGQTATAVFFGEHCCGCLSRSELAQRPASAGGSAVGQCGKVKFIVLFCAVQ